MYNGLHMGTTHRRTYRRMCMYGLTYGRTYARTQYLLSYVPYRKCIDCIDLPKFVLPSAGLVTVKIADYLIFHSIKCMPYPYLSSHAIDQSAKQECFILSYPCVFQTQCQWNPQYHMLRLSTRCTWMSQLFYNRNTVVNICHQNLHQRLR